MPVQTLRQSQRTMLDPSSLQPRDFYLACHSSVHGWGGGLAVSAGLAEAFNELGYSSLVLGVDDRRPIDDSFEPATPRLNLPSGVPRRLWRVRTWCLPRMLSRELRRLPPPKRAFVTVSPTWVSAARRAWPDVPVVFVFSCLLSNCLPFTWLKRRPASLWSRLDCAGVRHAERLAFAQADLTLAPTRQSMAEIQAFAPTCAPRLKQCYYGVRQLEVTPELRERQRRVIGAGPRHFVVAVIGFCDRNKAFDLALRALSQTDPRVRLAVIGDGPEQESLRHLAGSAGIADRVTFAGPQRAMAPWYAAADCVLSTSFYDTFPNVLLEAMHCGRPIIAPEHEPPHVYSGLAEVVNEHSSGRLYRRGDLADLVACINELACNPEQAKRLGARGRTAMEQRYRWSVAAKRILSHCGIDPRSLAKPRRPLRGRPTPPRVPIS